MSSRPLFTSFSAGFVACDVVVLRECNFSLVKDFIIRCKVRGRKFEFSANYCPRPGFSSRPLCLLFRAHIFACVSRTLLRNEVRNEVSACCIFGSTANLSQPSSSTLHCIFWMSNFTCPNISCSGKTEESTSWMEPTLRCLFLQ